MDRETTLTGMIRGYLEELVEEETSFGRGRRQLEALERSFEAFQFKVGKRTWTRADLHESS